ncbi:hypothetical protein [uncultured Cedecea sp.]|uniref:hypothetical protein n=1 Tax=uncultured Cedecea sp. TaxID=988762 RepID=UPI00262658BE|nr:hypothetical protein [uncultured Cedecea sp.]
MNRLVIAGSKPGIHCHTGIADCTATAKRQGLQVLPRQILVRVEDKTTPITYRYSKGGRCIQVCTTKTIHLVNHATVRENNREKRRASMSEPSNMTKFAEHQEGEK